MYMETTGIDAERTVGEIQQLLAKAGASQIATAYEDRIVTGLRWTLEIDGDTVPFMMPVRIEPVFRYLQGRRSRGYKSRNEQKDREQARRVAWRQLLRWVQAQLALIETGMVKADEVFMPYVQVGPEETLYERLASGGFNKQLKALPAPAEKVRQIR